MPNQVLLLMFTAETSEGLKKFPVRLTALVRQFGMIFSTNIFGLSHPSAKKPQWQIAEIDEKVNSR